MGKVRYQVDGIGGLGANAAAFMPMPGLTPAGATHGDVDVFGAWGTLRVPAPRPATSPRSSSSPATGERVPSDVSPNYMLPQIGIAGTRNMRPPVRYLPQAMRHRIPTPAGSITVQPSDVRQRGRKIGQRWAMIWPRTVTRWPNVLHRGDNNAY